MIEGFDESGKCGRVKLKLETTVIRGSKKNLGIPPRIIQSASKLSDVSMHRVNSDYCESIYIGLKQRLHIGGQRMPSCKGNMCHSGINRLLDLSLGSNVACCVDNLPERGFNLPPVEESLNWQCARDRREEAP